MNFYDSKSGNGLLDLFYRFKVLGWSPCWVKRLIYSILIIFRQHETTFEPSLLVVKVSIVQRTVIHMSILGQVTPALGRGSTDITSTAPFCLMKV